jgi:multidrug efflux system membrane fusion protein
VYIVRPDKTVEARNVVVATTEGNVAQIASGVMPNETVVTDGQDKLQNNSRVEPHAVPGTAAGEKTEHPEQPSAQADGNRGRQNRQNDRKETGSGNTGTTSR